MRTIRNGLSIWLICAVCSVYAQQGKPSPESNIGTEQAAESGQDVNSPDAPASTAAANPATANDTTATVTDGAPSPANATVGQRVSSSSGSPAVLSEEKGQQRDGTNTVQRASMNMVGSPVNNINLDADRQTVDVDSELQDRQTYAQEKQISAQQQQGAGVENTSNKNEAEKSEYTSGKTDALYNENVSSGKGTEAVKEKETTEKENKRAKKKRGRGKGDKKQG